MNPLSTPNELQYLLSHKDQESLSQAFRLCHLFPAKNRSSLLLSLLRMPERFKQSRSASHLSRIISSEFILRKKILQLAIHSPKKRHLFVKGFHTELHYPFGTKSALGILIVLNIFHDREVFEETQVRSALSRVIPNAEWVNDSFIEYRDKQIHVAYFEIEPTRWDKNVLQEELKECVKELVPKTFMHRNEEEVFKNIRILRDQLDAAGDIPQVIIQFEEQKDRHLYFTILLVRHYTKEEPLVRELIEKQGGALIFIPDRIAIVGHQKEANIFRLRMNKAQFLRKDGSVNLYKARKEIVDLLEKALGPIRDYVGGSMDQQNSALEEFIQLASKDHDPFLLENFFYSICPFEMQNILPVPLIYEWFLLFSKLFDAESHGSIKYPFNTISHLNDSAWMMAIRAEDCSFKGEIKSLLKKAVFVDFERKGAIYFGCLTRPAVNFEGLIHRALVRWNKRETKSHLKLGVQDLELNLDPRIAKEDQSYIIGKMLFEGLTRLDRDGKPTLALAQSYEVGDNFKRYIFHLRESCWSNGTPVTAFDFEYSWKKALQGSDIPTPFLYPLFLIKNAKSLNEKTLLVELNTPTPHFLEVAAHWSYSLINRCIDEKNPGWAYSEGNSYVCNGPFRLIQREPVTILKKNPLYWDAASVNLKKISIFHLEKKEHLPDLFERKKLDIVGRPLSALPKECLNLFDVGLHKVIQPLQGVLALCFNTQFSLLSHPKMRKAFAHAIDPTLFSSLVPQEFWNFSNSILPNRLTFFDKPLFPQFDPQLALKLFEEAVDELKTPMGPLTLHFCTGMERESLLKLLKKQLETILPVQIQLRPNRWGTHFHRMKEGHYHIGLIEFHALWSDPLHYLEFFEHKSHSLNYPKWESDEFQSLLKQGKEATSLSERNPFLKQAEKCLADQIPVFPLYQICGTHLKQPDLIDVATSEFFTIDFKWASKKS